MAVSSCSSFSVFVLSSIIMSGVIQVLFTFIQFLPVYRLANVYFKLDQSV